MQAHAKVIPALALMWGLAAQAAPAAPRLFPESVPQAEPSPVLAQEEEGFVIEEEPREEEVSMFGEEEKRGSDGGPYVLIGGGVDGYAGGGLANRLQVGPAAGAFVGVKDRVLGVELGYSTSGVDVDTGVAGGAGPGMDILRNSGQAALTVGLSNTPFQPFVLGGVGIDNYRIANGEELGLVDDQNFFAPVGAGARWNLNELLTLDARGTYNFLVGEQFFPGEEDSQRYGAQLSLGGTF